MEENVLNEKELDAIADKIAQRLQVPLVYVSKEQIANMVSYGKNSAKMRAIFLNPEFPHASPLFDHPRFLLEEVLSFFKKHEMQYQQGVLKTA